ncbi:MAG: MarR family transcriptional regulator [Burkholderiaceae bacterium]|nr:MarR family transcriptional regulator [Burkholderiaceae bacterium]
MSVTASAPAARAAKRRATHPPFFQASTFRPEASVLWLLRRVQTAVTQLVSEAAELESWTMQQAAPLYKIHRGEANTVADLARCCTLDAGSMTRLLDRLEARGLCRRVRSDTDRRVVHVELTTEGVATAEQIPQVLSRVYNEVLEGFTPQEWEQLRSLLGRMTDNAERKLNRSSAAREEQS